MSAYVWPCPGGRVTSKFGPRTPPKKGASSYHNGIDIAAASGTAILAAKPGKVIFTGTNSARGKYLKIDHGGGIVTLYQHCSKTLVSTGNVVKAGQKIALVGSTGISTGPHLHFEVQINGTAKNPLNYVSANDTTYTGANYPGAAQVVSTMQNTNSSSIEKESKEITTVVSKSVTGQSTAQKVSLTGLPVYLAQGVEILIQNDKVYLPSLEGDVKLERSRQGAPSKLTFTVLKDGVLNFQEGNPVTLRVNGQPVFAGFVFSKSRNDNVKIKVTAYDQIRYLKNKDTLSYANLTYAQLLKRVATDYHLKVGAVADTKYKIPARIEEGTLIDILQTASDLTVVNTGALFVLYDDFGKLTLKPLKDMILNVVVDEETAGGYDYTSSIDKDTYDRIKLAIDNDETGQRETHVLNEPGNQAKWGVLQYYEKLDGDSSAALLTQRAKTLLKYYNKKHRTLTIKKAFGDPRVRGGSLLVVKLGLGDISVQNYMCVEKVTHTWAAGVHTMDLNLSGIRGEFVI